MEESLEQVTGARSTIFEGGIASTDQAIRPRSALASKALALYARTIPGRQSRPPPPLVPESIAMPRACFALAFAFVIASNSAFASDGNPKPFPGVTGRWEGFVRHDFRVAGARFVSIYEPLIARAREVAA